MVCVNPLCKKFRKEEQWIDKCGQAMYRGPGPILGCCAIEEEGGGGETLLVRKSYWCRVWYHATRMKRNACSSERASIMLELCSSLFCFRSFLYTLSFENL
jgi:hypothetical protein